MSYRRHRSRTLGLTAITAIAAMAFLGTASASAAEFWAGVGEGEEAKVTGTNLNNHVFTAGSIGAISCTSATFTGHFTPSPSKEIEVTPHYTGCTFLGVSGVTVNMNGCTYLFTEPTGSGPFTGKVDVKCPEGKKITFSASGCTVEVGAQTGLATLTYTNKGAKEWVQVDADVKGIAYTGTILCPNTPGSHTNGTYKGSAEARADNEEEASVNGWVE